MTGISINELDGLVYDCSPANSCPANGEAVEATLGFNSYSIPMCAGILLAYITVCRMGAYLGLRFVKW